jgi:hypothetical protein
MLGAIGVVVGTCVLAGGALWIHRNHLDTFLTGRAVAQGQVIENRAEVFYTHGRTTGSSESHRSYRAIVRFTPEGGEAVTLADRFAFNHPSFRAGQAVIVFYDPQHPEHAMLDRGWKNYLPLLFCAIVAGLMLRGGSQLWTKKLDV